MLSTQVVMDAVLVGIGATMVMDLWLLLLKRLGLPTGNFALIGRWVAHLAHGRFAHDAIAKAAPVRGELALGWLTHYGTGVAFAGLLIAIHGAGWLHAPSLLPALAVGTATAVLPLFVVQPAMGSGVAGAKTSAPLLNCIRTLANHAVFGTGLFIAAAALTRIAA